MVNDRLDNRFIPALSGIRGIAATWVVLAHTPELMKVLFPAFDINSFAIVNHSYLGVDLFFVLSGFILSLVYSKGFSQNGFEESKAFYVGRILRIWPLNFVTLSMVALVGAIIPILGRVTHDVPSFIASALLVQQWVYRRTGIWNIPAWSLSAEALAYVVFPVIVIAVARLRSARSLLLLVCGSLAFFGLTNWFMHGNTVGLNVGNLGAFTRCLCEFTAGVALFHAAQKLDLSRPARRAIEIFSVVLVCLGIWTPVTILAPFGFCGLIFSCYKGGQVAYAFSRSVVLWLGVISFSLYLTHWLVLQIGEYVATSVNAGHWAAWEKAAFIALCAAAVLLVAHLTYNLVERPSHQFAKYVKRRALAKMKAAEEKGAVVAGNASSERAA